MRKRLEEGSFSISSEIEKEFIRTCIAPLGIEFSTQHYLSEIHHYCDVYVPSRNVVIEFQGDYWHGNPEKYLEEELTPYQRKKMDKDIELRKYCEENEILLVEIWESEYRRDVDGVKEKLRRLF